MWVTRRAWKRPSGWGAWVLALTQIVAMNPVFSICTKTIIIPPIAIGIVPNIPILFIPRVIVGLIWEPAGMRISSTISIIVGTTRILSITISVSTILDFVGVRAHLSLVHVGACHHFVHRMGWDVHGASWQWAVVDWGLGMSMERCVLKERRGNRWQPLCPSYMNLGVDRGRAHGGDSSLRNNRRPLSWVSGGHASCIRLLREVEAMDSFVGRCESRRG